MTWTPKLTQPTYGSSPYDWNSGSLYQCTWYAYWRVQEGFGMSDPPVWHTGTGTTGSGYYTHAKYWLDRWRSPWVAHTLGDGYTPKAGDIIVFTGTYGHCVVVEIANADSTYTITDYNLMGGEEKFGLMANYTYGDRIYGYMNTGACIGCLAYPDTSPPEPPGPTPMDPIHIAITADVVIDRKGGNINVKLFKE